MLNISISENPQGQQQLNANFARGDVINWAYQGTICGTPLNLTGVSIRMTIGFEIPVVFSTANGAITITDPTNGKFVITMPSSQTAAFPVGTFPYDVWIENQPSPPIENQYVTGSITITQSITAVP